MIKDRNDVSTKCVNEVFFAIIAGTLNSLSLSCIRGIS
jgi:hypothetical protein